ncbi:MAG: hypothetical protein AAFZ65_08800, partial [Planctomycetota bacterium]
LGVDTAGSRFCGYLSASDGRLQPIASSANAAAPLGVLGGPPWSLDEPGEEWIVDGHGFELRLHRFDHRHGLEVESWPIAQPSAAGAAGHTYFQSALDGDRLLVARCGTDRGLLVYSARSLVAEARDTAPGETLTTAPRHALATRSEAGAGSRRAMALALGDAPDGRRIAALAAGWDTQSGRALVQLYELPGDAAAAPARLGSCTPDEGQGNAIAVEFVRRGSRLWLLVADVGFGLRTWDVSDPSAPAPGPGWQAPPNAFDGARDRALDVVSDGRFAYVACARLGLVCLDLAELDAGVLPVRAVRDTPGMAYGVALGELAGRAVLAVGDHQAGVRLYAAQDG